MVHKLDYLCSEVIVRVKSKKDAGGRYLVMPVHPCRTCDMELQNALMENYCCNNKEKIATNHF